MSYSDVSGKHELKIFQHYGYFSSVGAAAGLYIVRSSDSSSYSSWRGSLDMVLQTDALDERVV